MRMKILLVAPAALVPSYEKASVRYPPVGLGYLCSHMKKEGHEVEILDVALEGWDNRNTLKEGHDRIGLSREKIKILIKEAKADLIGVSWLFTQQSPTIIEAIKDIHEVCPDTTLVVGGSHPSVNWKTVLNDYPEIDYIVVGEGEIAFSGMLE
jgi:hypothetical protein